MNTIHLEIMPWFSHYFTREQSISAILEVEVDDEGGY